MLKKLQYAVFFALNASYAILHSSKLAGVCLLHAYITWIIYIYLGGINT